MMSPLFFDDWTDDDADDDDDGDADDELTDLTKQIVE